MEKIENLSLAMLSSLEEYDISKMTMAQICDKKGIRCFESNFPLDSYGYIYKQGNQTSININKDIPPTQKEVVIASFLGAYSLNMLRDSERLFLNNSDFKIFNKYYEFGLHLYFNKKIIDGELKKEQVTTLRRLNSNIIKLNEINRISKKLNISLTHTFNYFNI